MKQILSLFLFASLFSFQSLAQDKEDMLEIFKLISELEETQILYQNDLRNGRNLIFTKPTKRALGRGDWNKEVFNAIFEITNDDLYDFSNPVSFMTEEEAEGMDILPRRLANCTIFYEPNNVRVIITAHLWESRQDYTGQFSFIRDTEADDWEVNSRQFDTRRSLH